MGNTERGIRTRAKRKPVISNSTDGITRKELFVLGPRILLGIFAGRVAAEGMATVLNSVNHAVAELGHQPGNAGLNEVTIQNCGSSPERLCVKNFIKEEPSYTMLTIVNPAQEELIYRLIFTIVHSILTKRDPIRDAAIGTGNPLLTKKELLTCFLSTTMFSVGHNRLSNGDFNTDTIPVGQFIAGTMYFYLQRVFGVASNLTAHILMNIFAIERM